MLDPLSGANRAARALVLGGICWLLTLAGHIAAGGPVSALGMALLAGLMVCVAGLVTGRELGLAPIAGFLLVNQLLAHLMLSALGTHGTSVDIGSVSGMHAGHHGSSLAIGHSGSVESLQMQLHLTSTMLIAHAVVIALAAGALRYGERVYFGLNAVVLIVWDTLSRPLTPLGNLVVLVHVLPAPEWSTHKKNAPQWFSSAISQRGPPQALVKPRNSLARDAFTHVFSRTTWSHPPLS